MVIRECDRFTLQSRRSVGPFCLRLTSALFSQGGLEAPAGFRLCCHTCQLHLHIPWEEQQPGGPGGPQKLMDLCSGTVVFLWNTSHR